MSRSVISIGFDYRKQLNQACRDIENAFDSIGQSSMSKEFEKMLHELRKAFMDFRSDINTSFELLSKNKLDTDTFHAFRIKVETELSNITNDILNLNNLLGNTGENINLSNSIAQFKELNEFIIKNNDSIKELLDLVKQTGSIAKFTPNTIDTKKIKEEIEDLTESLNVLLGKDLSQYENNNLNIDELTNDLKSFVQVFKDTQKNITDIRKKIKELEPDSAEYKEYTLQLDIMNAKLYKTAKQISVVRDAISRKGMKDYEEVMASVTGRNNIAGVDENGKQIKEKKDKPIRSIDEAVDVDEILSKIIPDNLDDKIDQIVDSGFDKVIQRIKNRIHSLNDLLSDESENLTNAIGNNGDVTATDVNRTKKGFGLEVHISTKDSTLWKELQEKIIKLQEKARKEPLIVPVKLYLAPMSETGKKQVETSSEYIKNAIKEMVENGEENVVSLDKVYNKTLKKAMLDAEVAVEESIKRVQLLMQEDKNIIRVGLKVPDEELQNISKAIVDGVGENKINITGEVDKAKNKIDGLVDSLKKLDNEINNDKKNKFYGLSEEIKKGVGNFGEELSNALKGSLNSIGELTKILDAIRDLEDLVSRSTGIVKKSDLDSQWNQIKFWYDYISDDKGNIYLTKQRDQIHKLLSDYQKYLELGGKNPLYSLTDNKNSVNKLYNEFNRLQNLSSKSIDISNESKQFNDVEKSVDSLITKIGTDKVVAINKEVDAMNNASINEVQSLSKITDELKKIIDLLNSISGIKLPKIDFGKITNLKELNTFLNNIEYVSNGNNIQSNINNSDKTGSEFGSLVRYWWKQNNNGIKNGNIVKENASYFNSKTGKVTEFIECEEAHVAQELLDTIYNRATFEVDSAIHTHGDWKTAAFSPNDLITAYNDVVFKKIKKQVLVSMDQVMTLDLNGVNGHILDDIIKEYSYKSEEIEDKLISEGVNDIEILQNELQKILLDLFNAHGLSKNLKVVSKKSWMNSNKALPGFKPSLYTTSSDSKNIVNNDNDSSVLLDLKPNINPDEFVNEVTEILKGHTAKIEVAPIIDTNKYENIVTSDSVSNINEESESLDKIVSSSTDAANAKDKFNKSNTELAIRTTKSTSNIEDENNALVSLNNTANNSNLDFVNDYMLESIQNINLEDTSEEFKNASEYARQYCNDLGDIATIIKQTGTYNNRNGDKFLRTSYRFTDVNGNSRTFDPNGNEIGSKDIYNVEGTYKKLLSLENEIYKIDLKEASGKKLTDEQLDRRLQITEEIREQEQMLYDIRVKGLNISKYESSLNSKRESNKKSLIETAINTNITSPYKYYSQIVKELSSPSNISKHTEEYANNIQRINVLLENLMKYGSQDFKVFDQNNILEVRSMVNEIDALVDSTKNMYKIANGAKKSGLITNIGEYISKNSSLKMDRQGRGYIAQLEDLQRQLRNVSLTAPELQDIVTQFNNIKDSINKAGLAGRSFFDVIKNKAFYMAAETFARLFSVHDIIRYSRTAVQKIIELDTALVDLQKTTKMNNTELNEFYFESTNIAKSMGVTTKEIIDQAAAWSRLGYNTKDASETMAELSSQFASISPGMDIDSATDGLVSSMKAFDVEVEDVERKIMDNINRIGNTAATSNSEIVDMLTRSSAAMAAANNSIEETIALETAAVEITRNAETTGTAFKTIAMRIRGYDEETEELSDDLQNISGDIANLTKVAGKGGISLFTDNTKQTYKSTYQILKEISEIWDQISDKQQAELLEKLAGKRGGQVIAGLLSNFDAAEKAIIEMESAAGSADAEMSIIQKSIDYKLNELQETWVDTFKYIISRDDIGNIISSITTLSEALGALIKNVGLVGTIGFGSGLFTGFLNNGPIRSVQLGDKQIVDIFGFRSRKYLKEQNKQKLKGLQSGFENINKYKESEKILSLPPKDANAWSVAWENAFGNASEDVKKLANSLKYGSITSDQFEESLKELISSTEESGKKIKLSTSLFSGFKNVLKGIGSGILLGVISFGIEKLVSVVYELATVDDKVAELANEASTSIQKTNSSIDEYKTKLEGLNKTIHSNSSTEEEIYNARKEMLDLQNSLVETFGEEAEGINLVTMSYERQIEVLNELQMKKNEEDLRRFNSASGANWFSNIVSGYSGNIERLEKEYFGNRTVTLHMSSDPFSNDLKVSDEYINKIRDIGAEFKKTTIAIDGLGDKVLSYATSDYNRNTLNTLNARDLQDGESVQLKDMIQFSGTAKEIYDQIMEVKRVIGNDDTFKYLNKQLDELAQEYGKLKDEYEDIAKQHVLNDYIFSNADENTYDEDFYKIRELKDKYEDALLTGNQDTIDAALKEYYDKQNEIQNKDLEMFDEDKEDQIHDFFLNMYPEVQSAVDEWNIRLKIKDIDVSSIKGKTKDEILKAETYESTKDKLTEEFDKAEKELREKFDKAKDDADLFYKYMWTGDESKEDLANNRVLLTMGGDFETLLAEQKDKIVKELGLTAEEYEFICKNIEDGTYDALNAIHAETDDTSKALEVLGIKSKQVIEDESKLSKSMVDSTKSAKDQIESLSQTLEKLRAGNLKSGDLITFLSDDANSEFIKSADNLESAIVERMKSIRQGAIDSVKDLPDDLRQYWTDVVNKAFDYDEATSKINEVNASLDKLQDGMKTLSSAFEEYNENGFITLDTLQSLMSENGEYIQMLTIENGQLKINEDGYKNIMAAKLNDFKATLDQAAAAEINALAEENAESKTRSNIQALNEETIAYSENTKEAIKNATEKGISSDDINNIINKYDTIWKTALKGYNKNFRQFSGLANSSAKDAQTKAKELFDNYIAVQDALLDAGKISFADYCRNVKGKLDEMYSSGKLSAKDYFDSVKTFLEKQQSIYDKILNAVTRRFDKEIEGIDKQITAINEENDALNKQKDEYDKILSVVQEVYDKEIESLQDQQEAIQDKIDALQKANDEEDRALALANARYALEKAQQQRTRLVYNGAEGFVYQTDSEAIRDAKKELKDVELENTIAALEDEKEALDKNIETLEEYKEKWSEVSDTYDKEVNRQLAIALWGENYEQMILQNRESDIQEFTDKYVELQKKVDDNTSLIESLEEKKEVYEELKKEWQDITSVYEQSIEDQLAAEYFGADWESQILSGRKATLEQFKDAYISIQEQIREAALRSAEAQEKAAAAGSGNTGSIPVTTSDTSTQNKVRNVSYLESDEGVIQEIDDIKEYVKTHARDLQNPYVRIKTEDITGYGVYDEKDKNYKKQVKSFETLNEALKFVDENKERKWKIRAIQAFAKGGVVNANNNNPLNNIASKLGEDTAVLARHGERILTPIQNQYWEKWTNAIPNLTKHLEKLKFNTPNLSSILNAVASKETTVKQEISISLPNVTNTSGAEYVLNALKTLPLEAVQRVNRR